MCTLMPFAITLPVMAKGINDQLDLRWTGFDLQYTITPAVKWNYPF